MNNCIVDICKMPFSDVEFFLHSELSEYNVMSFEFVSSNIDVAFQTLVSRLKGWYSVYIIQNSCDNYLKVTFVTKVPPSDFVRRIHYLTKYYKKGGINHEQTQTQTR